MKDHMNDLNRLRKLAGVNEQSEADDDASMAAYDAQSEREEKMKQLISGQFNACGLRPVNVTYDEYPDRSAVVTLDDEPLGWSVKSLERLQSTQLADDFKVIAYNNAVEVHFNVKADMDRRLN